MEGRELQRRMYGRRRGVDEPHRARDASEAPPRQAILPHVLLVDLVGEEDEAFAVGELDDGAHVLRGQCVARRVAGVDDDKRAHRDTPRAGRGEAVTDCGGLCEGREARSGLSAKGADSDSSHPLTSRRHPPFSARAYPTWTPPLSAIVAE